MQREEFEVFVKHRLFHRRRPRYASCRACCMERSIEIMLSRSRHHWDWLGEADL